MRGLCAAEQPSGNVIVASYALERRYDVVLGPDKSFNLDVALKMDDKTLMLLEVKLHRKDVGVSETQVDEIYAVIPWAKYIVAGGFVHAAGCC